MSDTGTENNLKPSKAPMYWTIGSAIGLVAFVVVCVMMIAGRKPVAKTSLSIDLNKPIDSLHGARLYQVSCATCHGSAGKGMPHQGAPLVGSHFVMNTDELQVIQMVKIGRSPNDPKSVMQLPMPARGGYPNLSDQDLRDIVGHIRSFNTKNDSKPNGKVSMVTQ